MPQQIGDGAVDVIITSPPYNLGIKYRSYDDDRSRAEYLEWTRQWARQVARVLAEKGSFFLNFDSPASDPGLAYDVLALMQWHFVLQNRFIWVKSYSPDLAGGAPCRGHVKPINSERFTNHAWEYVFHFTHDGKVPLDRLAVGVQFADKNNLKRGARGAHGDVRDAGDVWPIPYETIQHRAKDRPHPATFPVALAERCIRLHGAERTRLVLDPFCGLGSTLRAAEIVGVDSVGFEIDPYYAEIARGGTA
jgi:site-specific DNA-methyltransferase (adenine-specific)